MNKKITVKCPATIANFVCGFDIMGFAVNDPYDIFTVSITDKPGIEIINEDAFNLPVDASKNVSGVALQEMLNETKDVKGFQIISKKSIKPGSGIGSSAASAAGVVVAANHLLNNRFSKAELVQFAMFGEKLASGVKHADNIAPAIYGGTTLIRSIFPLDIVSIPSPDLFVTIIHPQIEVKTSDARNILKHTIPLKDAVKQWGNIAGLTTALITQDYDLLARSMVDVVVEPLRSKLIPHYYDVKNAGLNAGALGGGISGSGPSIFMLSKTAETAAAVELAMRNVYAETSIEFHTHVTTVNKTGVQIIED